MGRLDAKVAIVTGSGSGIGRATAKRMGAEGAKVVVADISAENARAVAQEIVDDGYEAIGVTTDVTDESQVAALVAAAAATFGGLDIIHANAGVADPEDLTVETMRLDVWERNIAVNLTGVMLSAKHAIPLLRKRGGGAIIVTSSVAGILADSVRPTYAATKAALLGLVRSIATGYGKDGIRCVAVLPGVIVTESAAAHFSDAIVDHYNRHTLTPRLGTPDDVANFVIYAASDEGSFLTGVGVPVDGGYTAHLATTADERDGRVGSVMTRKD